MSAEEYEGCLARSLDEVAATHLNRGLTHFKEGDLKASIEAFTKSIDVSSKNPVALSNRGLAYRKLKESKAALRDLNAAIEMSPTYMKPYYFRGLVLFDKRKYARAISSFDQALGLTDEAKDQANIWYHMGVAQRNAKQPLEGLNSFNTAINLNPDYAEAYFGRALIAQKQKNYTQAKTDYTQVITLQPDNAQAYYNRGLIHQKQGKDPLAKKDFSRAIEIDPGYIRARVSKSYSFIAPLIPILIVLALG